MKKKAISPVVATALLLVIAVMAVVGFQQWFTTYQSSVSTNVEQTGSISGTGRVDVQDIIGDSLYILNNVEDDLLVTKLEINGYSCNSSAFNLSLGMNTIDVSNCAFNTSDTKKDVVLITENSVTTKFIAVTTNPSSSSSSGGGPAWVSYVDDSAWTCNSNCVTWDGTDWEESGPGLSLLVDAAATWEEGFRPTKVRVTFTGEATLWELSVGLLGGGNDFGTCNNYVSGAECDITVTADIVRINIYGNTGSTVVQNIEFLE